MRVGRIFAVVLLTLAGCGPDRRPPEKPVVNAGVNIVPEAILASEKITPSTQPTDTNRPDLIQVLSQSQQHHQMILRALRTCDLASQLREKGPFTLLAPTDEAFSKLPPGTLDRLLARPEQLGALLRYHLLTGRILYKDLLATNGQVSASSGQTLIIRGIDSNVMVNDTNVIQSENSPSNGAIHWIDGVLLPPS